MALTYSTAFPLMNQDRSGIGGFSTPPPNPTEGQKRITASHANLLREAIYRRALVAGIGGSVTLPPLISVGDNFTTGFNTWLTAARTAIETILTSGFYVMSFSSTDPSTTYPWTKAGLLETSIGSAPFLSVHRRQHHAFNWQNGNWMTKTGGTKPPEAGYMNEIFYACEYLCYYKKAMSAITFGGTGVSMNDTSGTTYAYPVPYATTQLARNACAADMATYVSNGANWVSGTGGWSAGGQTHIFDSGSFVGIGSCNGSYANTSTFSIPSLAYAASDVCFPASGLRSVSPMSTFPYPSSCYPIGWARNSGLFSGFWVYSGTITQGTTYDAGGLYFPEAHGPGSYTLINNDIVDRRVSIGKSSGVAFNALVGSSFDGYRKGMWFPWGFPNAPGSSANDWPMTITF